MSIGPIGLRKQGQHLAGPRSLRIRIMVSPGLHSGHLGSVRSVPLSGRISAVFLERGRLEADRHRLLFTNAEGSIAIPAAMSSVIFLEPGTSVTHQAVQVCADAGTLLVWCSEAGGRIYSAARSREDPARILQQACVVADPSRRIQVARRILAMMTGVTPPPVRDIEQVRGIEGAWVRAEYHRLALAYRVPWRRRVNDGSRPSDALNEALSYATSMLYGVAEAAIIALGYSPSLGVVHSGDARSFVFDLADTIKFSTVVPAAFELVAESRSDIRNRARRRCRDLFRAHGTVSVLAERLEQIFAP